MVYGQTGNPQFLKCTIVAPWLEEDQGMWYVKLDNRLA